MLLERNLADRGRLLGTDHPDTLSTRGNLAIAYRDAGRTAEATALSIRHHDADDRIGGQ